MKFARARVEGKGSQQRSDTFTGTVWADPVLEDDDLSVNSIFFEPGARTHWHSHDGGQVLTVEHGRGIVADRDGEGRIVHAADVIYTHGGEEHWHGGTPGSYMLHTSVGIGQTNWLEPVDEAVYQAVYKKLEEQAGN